MPTFPESLASGGTRGHVSERYELSQNEMKTPEKGFFPKIKRQSLKMKCLSSCLQQGPLRGSRYWEVKGEWDVEDGEARKTTQTMVLVHKPWTAAFCYRHPT